MERRIAAREDEGSVLVQAMIASGVIAVTVLAYSSMIANSRRAASTYANRLLAEETATEVKFVLSSTEDCTAWLKSTRADGKLPPYPTTPATTESYVQQVTIGGMSTETIPGTGVLSVGTFVRGKLKVETLELRKPVRKGFSLVEKGESFFGIEATVRFRLKLPDKASWKMFGAPKLEYEIPLYLAVRANGDPPTGPMTIQFCTTTTPLLKKMLKPDVPPPNPPGGTYRPWEALDCLDRGGKLLPVREENGVLLHVCRIPDLDQSGAFHVECPLDQTVGNPFESAGVQNAPEGLWFGKMARRIPYSAPDFPPPPFVPGSAAYTVDRKPKRAAIDCY